MSAREVKEHPIVTTIKLREKAYKSKAHPKLVAVLDKRISNMASDLANRLWVTDKSFPVMSVIVKGNDEHY